MPSSFDPDSSSEESSEGSVKPIAPASRRTFEDEEGEDSDVLESWDAAEDSETERQNASKAAAAAAAKAKADAEAAAAKQSKAKRVAQHQAERTRQLAEDAGGVESEPETAPARALRLRQNEQEADLRHAEDLFGDVATGPRARTAKPGAGAGATVLLDPRDPSTAVDLADLPVFRPASKPQFDQLCQTVVSLLAANAQKPQYPLFLTELVKQLAQDLNSDQTKRIASALTTLGNEKMKREKEADRTGKKSKAQKTKLSLVASRPNIADVRVYDDNAFGEDDFM